MSYVNNTNVPLSIAAWLVNDDYDYDDDPNVISATSLIKPVRQLVLGSRVQSDANSMPTDIISLLKARLGQSVHTAIENTWINNPNLMTILKSLGVGPKAINKIKINPNKAELEEGDIPIYLEQRIKRSIAGKVISGKFDMCFNGQLEDIKSTSTFTYVKDTKSADYILQGSIYRWLAPDMITSDTIKINYIFTDWKQGQAYQKDYPATPVLAVEYPLMSLADTEKWIINRLDEIAKAAALPEIDIKFCTDEELWRSDPVWKYYKTSKAESKRATKNFDNDSSAAKQYYREQGYKGELVEVPGEVKACIFCKGYEICSQKNILIANGDLKVGD